MKVDWRQAGPALLLGLLIGAACGSWAQRALGRRWRAEPARLAERLGRRLALDDAQTKALTGVLEARRARLEELKAATDEEIRQLLDDEQRRRFDAMRARREARRRKP